MSTKIATDRSSSTVDDDGDNDKYENGDELEKMTSASPYPRTPQNKENTDEHGDVYSRVPVFDGNPGCSELEGKNNKPA